jgi:cation-transporting ATPase 13A3/4/5
LGISAALTIGIIAAQMRLKKKKIFCISPSTINTCGGINAVCFDKTGTLTEDGLDFHCLRPIIGGGEKAIFGDEVRDFSTDNLLRQAESIRAMASCHSLAR